MPPESQLVVGVGDIHGRFHRVEAWMDALEAARGRPVDLVLAVGDVEAFRRPDAYQRSRISITPPLAPCSSRCTRVAAEAWSCGEEGATVMTTLEPLGGVLARMEEFDWEHDVYVDAPPPWTEKTRCAVLEGDPYTGEPPEFARKHSLRRALSADQAKGVVENARLQKPDVTPAELVKAFNYYYQHDAFMELGRRSR